MILKHKDIDIPSKNPFLNCKLDREKYAKSLTSVIETYADGFVLAVDNKWGAGKTTFIKMWKKYLEKEFKTLYFNAWENDAEGEALPALLAELSSLDTDGENKKDFENVKNIAVKLFKRAIPLLVKSLAKKYLDNEEFSKIFGEAAEDFLSEQISEYNDKKENLEEFKEKLGGYVKEIGGNKPIVFFIDELDRCRPNYAIEVLEKIKHFFEVPGIVFVLSIDKEQLGHAVCGYYGSDKIDSDEYLRRFIDLEFSLPKPDKDKWVDYLFDYFSINEYLQQNDIGIFINRFLNYKNLPLRVEEKILSRLSIVLKSLGKNRHNYPSVVFFLLYLKHFYNDLYIEIVEGKLTLQELVDKIEDNKLEFANIHNNTSS